MIGLFSKLKDVVDKKRLEILRKQAKPYFDFVNFLTANNIKFYQKFDVDGKEMILDIDPSMDRINEWVLKYFEALKWIEKNKENKKNECN